jgi:hypothetical protein
LHLLALLKLPLFVILSASHANHRLIHSGLLWEHTIQGGSHDVRHSIAVLLELEPALATSGSHDYLIN